MEFDTSIVGGKAPRDGAALSIALSLQSGKTLLQDLHALHPARQAAAGKDGDLDFGHIEPGFHVWACNGTLPAAKSVWPEPAQRLHKGRQGCGY